MDNFTFTDKSRTVQYVCTDSRQQVGQQNSSRIMYMVSAFRVET